MRPELTIRERLVALFGYVVALTAVGGLVTGIWLPTGGLKSAWYFGAIGLVFFTHLSAPFFVPPRDSLVNSATASLLLATTDLQSVGILGFQLDFFRWVSFGLSVFTSAASFAAIGLYLPKRSSDQFLSSTSRVMYWISTRLGRGQVVFTPLVLVSIIGGYQGEPIQQIWLLFIWALLIFMEPVDLVIAAVKELSQLRSGSEKAIIVGQIQRIDDPGILRVKLESTQSWSRDNVHIASFPDSRQLEVVPLFFQVQEEGTIGTGICHRKPSTTIDDAIAGVVYQAPAARKASEVISEMCGIKPAAELIGFVVENSEISAIRFEVTSEVDLEEGSLVFVRQRGEPVYYQILGARTGEEIFSKNPRGTHVAIASQLGVLKTEGGFGMFAWVPSMNSPVFLLRREALQVEEKHDPDEFQLGFVPNSNIPVISSVSDMLEYHTAILGVTGMGKTELAFDIIRFALGQGVKIFCVDFTGEYKPRLADLKPKELGLDAARAADLQERLFDVEEGDYAAGNEKRALREFVAEIHPEIRKRVSEFLEPKGPDLGIFELEEIANTKATLRATELYLSSIFDWARRNRRKRQILLVLEEAHTVIPEFNLFGHDRVETGAVVGRMAQIALQGRKYGVGILLISQRTALVSKTLLSQCNTVITFALHDETGLNYLANVFSSDHVSAIPNLNFLQAMAFGKAIKSNRPIIFEIPEDDEKKKASEALYAH